MFGFMLVMFVIGTVVGILEIVRDTIIDRNERWEYSHDQWFWYYPPKEAGDWFDNYECPEVFKVPEDMVFIKPLDDDEFVMDVSSEDGDVVMLFGKNPERVGPGQMFINIMSTYLADIDLHYKAESWNSRDLTRIIINDNGME